MALDNVADPALYRELEHYFAEFEPRLTEARDALTACNETDNRFQSDQRLIDDPGWRASKIAAVDRLQAAGLALYVQLGSGGAVQQGLDARVHDIGHATMMFAAHYKAGLLEDDPLDFILADVESRKAVAAIDRFEAERLRLGNLALGRASALKPESAFHEVLLTRWEAVRNAIAADIELHDMLASDPQLRQDAGWLAKKQAGLDMIDAAGQGMVVVGELHVPSGLQRLTTTMGAAGLSMQSMASQYKGGCALGNNAMIDAGDKAKKDASSAIHGIYTEMHRLGLL
jgi:hypothetical protein